MNRIEQDGCQRITNINSFIKNGCVTFLPMTDTVMAMVEFSQSDLLSQTVQVYTPLSLSWRELVEIFFELTSLSLRKQFPVQEEVHLYWTLEEDKPP